MFTISLSLSVVVCICIFAVLQHSVGLFPCLHPFLRVHLFVSLLSSWLSFICYDTFWCRPIDRQRLLLLLQCWYTWMFSRVTLIVTGLHTSKSTPSAAPWAISVMQNSYYCRWSIPSESQNVLTSLDEKLGRTLDVLMSWGTKNG